MYVFDVSPLIAVHDPPVELQRSQAYANVGVGLPDQVPLLVLKVLPTCAVPETAGGVMFEGAVSADAASPTAASVAARASTAPRAVSARRRRRGVITKPLSFDRHSERTPRSQEVLPAKQTPYELRTLGEP